MIKQLTKIINYGVEPNMSFGMQNNIRNINRLGLFGAPAPMALSVIFLTEYNFIAEFIILNTISFFLLLIPYLNSKKLFSLAKAGFVFPGSLNILFLSWAFGTQSNFIYYAFMFYVFVFAFYTKTKEIIALGIYLCFWTAAYFIIPAYFKPLIIINDFTILNTFNITTAISYVVLFLTFMRIENVAYLKSISEKNNLLEVSKSLIEEKNKELTDSINYAKHIQYALLVDKSLLGQNLSEHFVLFKPKSVVSGDFYWGTIKDDYLYFALCDSTGHGVPGAFMSLLNISFLNEAVIERGITEPNEIFNYVRTRLIDSLATEGRRDGMDGVLLKMKLNTDKIKIEYAGANEGPIIIKDAVIKKLPYDKMPVGKADNYKSFNNYEFELDKGDVFYLSTDGFVDQFGGENGKKFMKKQLLITLQEFSPLELHSQKELLNKKFEDWKGDLEQIDDVSLIGFRV